MINASLSAVAVLGGGLLGAFFFAGLWWTTRRGMNSRQPFVWFSVSPVIRIGIVLVGFYFVSGGKGDRMLACLAGFVLCRFLLTSRLTGRAR